MECATTPKPTAPAQAVFYFPQITIFLKEQNVEKIATL